MEKQERSLLDRLCGAATGVKKSWKIAFFSTFLIGLLVHFYQITNYVPNHDSILNVYSDQNVVGSGRWLLSLACGFSSYFDLPWVTGILSLLFVSATTVVIAELFQMEKPLLIVLTGGLMASFPALTQTFGYIYTADGYMIAMFLAALSVYVTRFGTEGWWRTPLAAVLICMACGIYQAYASFGMVLALCYFAWELLEGRRANKEIKKWILSQLMAYGAGLALYYVGWKLCMKLEGVSATSYMGIDDAGKISLGTLLSGAKQTGKDHLKAVLGVDVKRLGVRGVPFSGVLNLLMLLAAAGGLLWAAIKSGLGKKKGRLALLLLSLGAIPLAAFLWNFSGSSGIKYRPMMLYSLCPAYILTAAVYGRWLRLRWRDLAWTLVMVIVFNQGLTANIFYRQLETGYARSYAAGAEMAARIHLLQEEGVTKIAVVGNKQYANKAPDHFPRCVETMVSALETDFLYDREHTYSFLSSMFEVELEPLEKSGVKELEGTEEVVQMPCWPAEGSIRVIGDTIVIKLA